MQETRIALKREFLSFTCREDNALVNVLFEFFNPDPEARTLTVGFQSPSAYSPGGDDAEHMELPITDLRIMNDGRLLPYRIMMAKNEDAPLVDLGTLTFTMDERGIFVYLFEMTFKPGVNKVQHSYRHRAGSSVMNDRFYSYILTTGAKWAGGTIGDLTFEMDMGPNSRFQVDDVFGPNANWSVAGIGSVGPSSTGYAEEPGTRIVRVLDGKLIVTVRDLSPKNNIHVTGRPSTLYLGFYEDAEVLGQEVQLAWIYRNLDVGPLTKEELRLLRNMVFAQHGYVFKDPEVQKNFDRFDWYIPDPNQKWDNGILSPEDRLFVELIKLKEAE